jgi:hypothetical protein
MTAYAIPPRRPRWIEWSAATTSSQLQAKGITPLCPFGFGLSYTNFRFSNLTVTPNASGAVARFDVQDTGTRAGADVAQAYIGMPASTEDRATLSRAAAKLPLGAY